MIKRISALRKSESGFTLIELMIVMIVLGILAGIVIFAVGNFDDEASTARSTSNTRICQTAQAAADASTASDAASNFASGC